MKSPLFHRLGDRSLSASAALFGIALIFGHPATAAEHMITCERSGEGQYAAMAFDLHQLDISSGQGEIDHELELRFTMHAIIRQADPARPGWVGPVLCDGQSHWTQNVPELDILYEGFMRYHLQHRVIIRNVPRFSVVTLNFRVTEDDDMGLDFADLNPIQGQGDLELTLWPNDRNGQTPQAAGNTRDLTFERRKRIVGSGSGVLEDFRAAVEFTVSMLTPQAIGGAVGGNAPPEIGGATSNAPPAVGGAIGPREARCRAYAANAVRQNATQMQLQCGFAPPVWNSDPFAHFSWCMESNNDTQTEAGILLREAGLASCRQGK